MRRNGDADEDDAFTEGAFDERAGGVATDIAEPATVRGFSQEVAPLLR